MSEETQTIWTCSRCKRVEVVKGSGEPKGWIRVYLTHPPRCPKYEQMGDLCKRCEKFVYAYVNGTYKEEVAKEQHMLEMLEAVNAAVNAQ